MFPATREEKISSGEVRLLVCTDCGTIRLGDTFPPEGMYGDNYGYRNGLNFLIVAHLASIARHLEVRANLRLGHAVLDIGAENGTFFRSYNVSGLNKIGNYPTVAKFS